MPVNKMRIMFTNQNHRHYTTNYVKSKSVVFGLTGKRTLKSSVKKPCNSCIAPPSSTSIDALLAKERKQRAAVERAAAERAAAERAATERAATEARERAAAEKAAAERAATERAATEARERAAAEKAATERAAVEKAAAERAAAERAAVEKATAEKAEKAEKAAAEAVKAEQAAAAEKAAAAETKEEELGVVFEKSITGVLTDNFESGVMQNDKHVLLLLYAPWCGWCKRMAPDFIKATEILASTNSVELMVVDATQWQVTHPKVQIQGFPTAFLFKTGDKENPIEYNGDRSAKDLVKFVETHLGVEVPNVQLEITEVATNKLIEMTDNFENVVMKNEDDVFVMFYAPWCGWCKKMMPEVEALAQHYSSKNKTRIVRMDATAHTPVHDKVKIYGFPLVHLFKANDKANPVEYRGDRTKDDMILFIEEHAVNK